MTTRTQRSLEPLERGPCSFGARLAPTAIISLSSRTMSVEKEGVRRLVDAQPQGTRVGRGAVDGSCGALRVSSVRHEIDALVWSGWMADAWASWPEAGAV